MRSANLRRLGETSPSVSSFVQVKEVWRIPISLASTSEGSRTCWWETDFSSVYWSRSSVCQRVSPRSKIGYLECPTSWRNSFIRSKPTLAANKLAGVNVSTSKKLTLNDRRYGLGQKMQIALEESKRFVDMSEIMTTGCVYFQRTCNRWEYLWSYNTRMNSQMQNNERFPYR